MLKLLKLHLHPLKFLIMDEEKPTNLSLVYFEARGLAQLIRMVLFEIGTQFEETFITMNGPIPEHLKDLGIETNKVPCIICEGKLVCEIFPVIKFLCRKYERIDLLGKNIKDETIINEIMIRYVTKKNKTLEVLLETLGQCAKHPEKVPFIKQEILDKFFKMKPYLSSASKLYVESGTYLMGYLTVLDFMFYDECFYFTNIFSELGKKKHPTFVIYKNFFEKTEFYTKNKEAINKYKILIPDLPKEIHVGLRLMWSGDQQCL